MNSLDQAARAAILIAHEHAVGPHAHASEADDGLWRHGDADLVFSWFLGGGGYVPSASGWEGLQAILHDIALDDSRTGADDAGPVGRGSFFAKWMIEQAPKVTCDVAPCWTDDVVERALVWHQPDLCVPPVQRKGGLRYRHRFEHDFRYVFVGRAGKDDCTRSYVVFVECKLSTGMGDRNAWILGGEPAVLKLGQRQRPSAGATRVKGLEARASRELMMCVVPLPAAAHSGRSSSHALMSWIAALVGSERAPVLADLMDDAAVSGEEDDDSWLSLRRYADVFLGDGARRRALDAHLRAARRRSGRRESGADAD